MLALLGMVVTMVGQLLAAAAAAIVLLVICGVALVFTLVCAAPLNRLRA